MDADKKLNEAAELRQEMIDATAALFELARYDGQAYRAWVQQFIQNGTAIMPAR